MFGVSSLSFQKKFSFLYDKIFFTNLDFKIFHSFATFFYLFFLSHPQWTEKNNHRHTLTVIKIQLFTLLFLQ